MLPSDLLVVKRKYPFIYPKFLLLDKKNIELASKLVNIFKNGIGKKREEIDTRIKEVEVTAYSEGVDYRVPRGLSHILYRRAVFEQQKTSIDPYKLRKDMFLLVNRMFSGFVLVNHEKEEIFNILSKRYGIPLSEIENILETYYEENYLLSSFEEISPIILLEEYNLSLLQTLLYKALYLQADLYIDGTSMKVLLYNAKRLGLMYFAEKISGNYNVRLMIDGPSSIFKQTERYGTRLARLIPYIVSSYKWSIRAKINHRSRKYILYLDEKKRHLFPKKKFTLIEYDSSIEEHFYKRFKTLGSRWIIRREPEPIVVDHSIFIPDFSFEYKGIKVYLEIVGFWTPEYLRRKIDKIKRIKNIDMIIAVQRDLAASRDFSSLPYTVIVYKNKLSSVDVYRILKKFMPQNKVEEKKEINEIVVDQNVRAYLKSIDNASLDTLLKKLKEYNIDEKDAIRLLEKEGFEIIWGSLDPKDVIVRKRQKI